MQKGVTGNDMDHIEGILKRKNISVKIRRTKAFTKVPNWFIESAHFTVYEKMVAIVIQKHLMNKLRAWPSHTKIATQADCSVSTVKKAIIGLEKKSVLRKLRDPEYKTNIYFLEIVGK